MLTHKYKSAFKWFKRFIILKIYIKKKKKRYAMSLLPKLKPCRLDYPNQKLEMNVVRKGWRKKRMEEGHVCLGCSCLE